MLNQVVVVGRLVDNVELKENEEGIKIASVTLAVQRSFKNITGDYKVDYIDCFLMQGVAESTSVYCIKDSVIGIKGRLISSSYIDEKGQKKNSVEIIAEKVSFLGYPKTTTNINNNEELMEIIEEKNFTQEFTEDGMNIIIDEKTYLVEKKYINLTEIGRTLFVFNEEYQIGLEKSFINELKNLGY